MSDISIFSLIGEATLFAQLVLALLVVLLYFSIWYIFRKRFVLGDYEAKCNAFDKAFWTGGNIALLEDRVRGREFGDYGLAQVFLFGQDEFKKACESGDNPELILEGVERALNIAIQNEETRLNRHMQFLATVASVSPLIGLLGTVWGVMNTFLSLAGASQATIAQVAPGIAEALVATAMGILAAVPALVAYNYFSNRIEKLLARFDGFSNHYLNILHRNM